MLTVLYRDWKRAGRKRAHTLALVLLSVSAVSLNAQSATPPIALRGTAFDSLHNRPLSGATVRVVGRDASAVSDERGHFQFDSLPAGPYLITLEHAELDSIGLPEILQRTELSATRRDVQFAVPSFATLWRSMCGDRPAPKDSGFVYGTIQNATSAGGVSLARVAIAWTDVGVNASKKLRQTRFTLDTRADSLGRYVACGVPVDVPLTITAAPEATPATSIETPKVASNDAAPADSATPTRTSVSLELPARASRVQRRDVLLAIAATGATGSTGAAVITGSVRGRLTAADGAPVGNVRVLIDDEEAGRSDDEGNYLLATVPAGTRTLQFIAIGNLPVSRIVDVVAGQTATVSAALERVTTLENVDVKGTRVNEILREFEERKRMGFGYVRDSTAFRGIGNISAALGAFPTLKIQTARSGKILALSFNMGTGTCAPAIFLDRVRVDAEILSSIFPNDIAWIEAYPRAFTTPREFMNSGGCGALALFTKRLIQR